MERLIVKKIDGGFIGMRNGTKEPVDVWKWIKKLKEVNPLLAEDYEKDYISFMKKNQK